MIYMRGQAADYDHWRQLGCTGWGWDDVLPLFKASEDYFAGASADHGAGGEWRVEKQRLRWDVLDDFARAAQAAGIPATDDFNTGDNEGVGYFKVNQRGGWRVSTAKAFLRPALSRPNLTVMTDTQVRRVLFDGRRATGVEVIQGGQTRVIAGGQIILSAGAIGSPQILMLSGIGEAAHLASHGIGVAADGTPAGDRTQSVFAPSTITSPTLTGFWPNSLNRTAEPSRTTMIFTQS